MSKFIENKLEEFEKLEKKLVAVFGTHLHSTEIKNFLKQALEEMEKHTLDRVKEVIEAWNNKGSHPEYHDAMKLKLHMEWPKLHDSIHKLASINKLYDKN